MKMGLFLAFAKVLEDEEEVMKDPNQSVSFSISLKKRHLEALPIHLSTHLGRTRRQGTMLFKLS